MTITITNNYAQDLAAARKAGLCAKRKPKKEDLYAAIAEYNAAQVAPEVKPAEQEAPKEESSFELVEVSRFDLPENIHRCDFVEGFEQWWADAREKGWELEGEIHNGYVAYQWQRREQAAPAPAPDAEALVEDLRELNVEEYQLLLDQLAELQGKMAEAEQAIFAAKDKPAAEQAQALKRALTKEVKALRRAIAEIEARDQKLAAEQEPAPAPDAEAPAPDAAGELGPAQAILEQERADLMTRINKLEAAKLKAASRKEYSLINRQVQAATRELLVKEQAIAVLVREQAKANEPKDEPKAKKLRATSEAWARQRKAPAEVLTELECLWADAEDKGRKVIAQMLGTSTGRLGKRLKAYTILRDNDDIRAAFLAGRISYSALQELAVRRDGMEQLKALATR